MTTEELFDAVAPIAIYHCCDLRFEQKAKIGLRKLRVALPVAAQFKLADMRDWAKERYDEAMVEIVSDLRPDWTWSHDKWGAKTWYDAGKQMVMSGDGNGEFPWFETAALLQARVEEHVEEQQCAP